jgi:large subunit ribosomal protein L18
MAKSAHYRVQLRRRRAGKTDYQARKAMVISGKPRLVVRPSLKNVSVQIIVAKAIGDQTLVSANSRELIKKYGWKAATGNIPAAYLTGLLCGLKAKTAGINQAILDIGMVIPTKGSKVFAVLNGVLDAGVEVPHGEEKIVADRNKGDHIATYAEELGVGSDEYKAKFSRFLAAEVAPEKLPEHYRTVKAAIAASFKGITIAPEPETKPKKAPAKPAPAKEKAAPPKEKAPPAKAPEPVPVPVKEKAPEPAPVVKEEAPKPKAEEKAPEVKAEPAKAAPAEAPVEKPAKAPKAKAEKAPAKAKAAKAAKAEVTEEAPAKEAKVKAAPKKAAAKEKAPAKEKAVKEEKAAPAKEKAPAKKVAKKGENKE